MTTEEKAALVEYCISVIMEHVHHGGDRNEEVIYRIAHAALTAEPVAAVLPEDIYWLKNGGKAEVSSHYIRMEGSLKLFAAPTP